MANFVINDQNGQFVAQVNWIAPALNNVLYRYNEDQVRYVLNYGRPGTPMAAWGAPGGGPLTTQQIDELIAYLWSVQLKPEEMRTQVDDFVRGIDPGLADRMREVRTSNEDVVPNGDWRRSTPTACPGADEIKVGEILFNNQELAAGSYSCARCHVEGANYGKAWEPFQRLQYGAFGPSLIGVENQATEQQHFNLVWTRHGRGQDLLLPQAGQPADARLRREPQHRQGRGGRPRPGPPRACSPPSRCGRSSPTSGTCPTTPR